MLYTKRSVRYTKSEIAAYQSRGIDVSHIRTYRQYVKAVKQYAKNNSKEKEKMAKRYGRRALDGTMQYFDSVEELREAHRRDGAVIRRTLFGIIGLLAGGIAAYLLMQHWNIDSRILRFVGVVAGIWLGGFLGASLSRLLWMILKWTLMIAVIAALVFLIYRVV